MVNAGWCSGCESVIIVAAESGVEGAEIGAIVLTGGLELRDEEIDIITFAVGFAAAGDAEIFIHYDYAAAGAFIYCHEIVYIAKLNDFGKVVIKFIGIDAHELTELRIGINSPSGGDGYAYVGPLI